jgi:hypothetical protein
MRPIIIIVRVIETVTERVDAFIIPASPFRNFIDVIVAVHHHAHTQRQPQAQDTIMILMNEWCK